MRVRVRVRASPNLLAHGLEPPLLLLVEVAHVRRADDAVAVVVEHVEPVLHGGVALLVFLGEQEER